MKKTKLGAALLTALSFLTPKLAQDSTLSGKVAEANKKDFDAKKVKAQILALDSEIDKQMLDEVIDNIIGIEDNPEPKEPIVADGTPEEKIRAMLAGKVEDSVISEIVKLCTPVAQDAEKDDKDDKDDEKMDKKEVKQAMDALRKDLSELHAAEKHVRPVVGDIKIAMDSASDIYKFALKQMGIAYDGISDAVALKALFDLGLTKTTEVKKPPQIAQDGLKDIVAKHPNVLRFGQK